ncbi:MAG: hypothetical protein ACLUB5_04775 [Bifidobacterium dentium]
MAEYKTQVEQYRLFEINLTGTEAPISDVTLRRLHQCRVGQIVVVGGYRSNGNSPCASWHRRRGGGHSPGHDPALDKPASSP